MGRRKVKLELITNESVRKTTFRKRKGGLFKKISELKILCGVDACSIIFGPNEEEPHIWPSIDEAARVVDRLHSLPSHKQGKHMLNHEQYIDKSLCDLEMKLERGAKRNREMEIELRLKELLSPNMGDDLLEEISMDEIKELFKILGEKVEEILIKLDGFKDSSQQSEDNEEGDSY